VRTTCLKTEHPDIVIILLDCVRASDVAGTEGDPSTDIPTITNLRSSAINFPRTIAPSTWSVPSHASLFTGLDPWLHGCHAANRLELDPGFPTLASALQREGYKTVCLSANSWMNEIPGLARGFEVLESDRWGSWLHRDPVDSHTRRRRASPDGGKVATASPLLAGRPGALAAVVAHQFPWSIEITRRVLNELEPNRDHLPHAAPWIESEFRSILLETPRSQPVFFFLNLMDAHEPILLSRDASPRLKEWLRYYSIPQSFLAYARAKRSDPSRLALLHREYQRSIHRLDGRLREIISALREVGRWDRTLLVATSDHGQSFGEDGGVFHTGPPMPARVRIPLIIRPPGGSPSAAQVEHWTSLSSVKQMVLDTALGAGPSGFPSNSSAGPLVGDQVAYTCSDGVLHGFPLSWFLPDASLRRVGVVMGGAYTGKFVLTAAAGDENPRVHLCDGEVDSPSPIPWKKDLVPESVVAQVKSIAMRVRSVSESDDQGRTRHLQEWGYI
jgi:arylsulfatase A-like enzyme